MTKTFLLILLLSVCAFSQTPSETIYLDNNSKAATEDGKAATPYKSFSTFLASYKFTQVDVNLVFVKGSSLVLSQEWILPVTIKNLNIYVADNLGPANLTISGNASIDLNQTNLAINQLMIILNGSLNRNSYIISRGGKVSIQGLNFTLASSTVSNSSVAPYLFEIISGTFELAAAGTEKRTHYLSNLNNVGFVNINNPSADFLPPSTITVDLLDTVSSVALFHVTNSTKIFKFPQFSVQNSQPSLLYVCDSQSVYLDSFTLAQNKAINSSNSVLVRSDNVKYFELNSWNMESLKNIRVVSLNNVEFANFTKLSLQDGDFSDSPIVLRNTSSIFVSTTVKNNKGAGRGGLINVIDSWVNINGCTFTDNSGAFGPTLVIDNARLLELPKISQIEKITSWIEGGRFENNTASVAGGAFILIFPPTNSTFFTGAFESDFKYLKSALGVGFKDNKVRSTPKNFTTGNSWDLKVDLTFKKDSPATLNTSASGQVFIDNAAPAKNIFQRLSIKVVDQFGDPEIPSYGDRRSFGNAWFFSPDLNTSHFIGRDPVNGSNSTNDSVVAKTLRRLSQENGNAGGNSNNNGNSAGNNSNAGGNSGNNSNAGGNNNSNAGGNNNSNAGGNNNSNAGGNNNSNAGGNNNSNAGGNNNPNGNPANNSKPNNAKPLPPPIPSNINDTISNSPIGKIQKKVNRNSSCYNSWRGGALVKAPSANINDTQENLDFDDQLVINAPEGTWYLVLDLGLPAYSALSRTALPNLLFIDNHSFYVLPVNFNDSYCSCGDGSYFESQNCKKCHDSCLTCSKAGSKGCLLCPSGSPSILGSCKCDEGSVLTQDGCIAKDAAKALVNNKTANETKNISDLSNYASLVQGLAASNSNKSQDDVRNASKKVDEIVKKLSDLLPANATLDKAKKNQAVGVLVKVTQDKELVSKDSLKTVSSLLDRISDSSSDDLDSDSNKQALFTSSYALDSLKSIGANLSDTERLEISSNIKKSAKKLADSQSKMEAANLNIGETKEVIAENIKIVVSNVLLKNDSDTDLKAGNATLTMPASLSSIFPSDQKLVTQVIEWSNNPYEYATNSSVLSNVFSIEYKTGDNLTTKALNNLTDPIVFSLKINNQTVKNFSCVYWNETRNGSWSTSGVKLVKIESGSAYCAASHTTDFAVNLEGDTNPIVPSNSSDGGNTGGKFGERMILDILAYLSFLAMALIYLN